MNKEKRKRYSERWEIISATIRIDRAKNRCEKCSAVHGSIIKRLSGSSFRLATAEELKAVDNYKKVHKTKLLSTLKNFRLIQVALNVAHLNHIETDDRPINLLCMCQRCHLMHDRQDNRMRQKKVSISQLIIPALD